MLTEYKIEKNIPIVKDSRKGSKLTNPLYLIAKKMKVGDSVKLIALDDPGEIQEDFTLEQQLEFRQKTYDYEDSLNAPNNLRRYLNELYGKGSGAIRSLCNIPNENTNQRGARVWRIK